MNYVGRLMIILGVLSSILSLFDYEMKLLMWIDKWGTGPAWGIRIGLIVVGFLLWNATRKPDR